MEGTARADNAGVRCPRRAFCQQAGQEHGIDAKHDAEVMNCTAMYLSERTVFTFVNEEGAARLLQG